ncbi:MAG: hypothetical protein SWX82_03910 [Cyanobacteriota bacterium]|nr:hypothetical protein [Cyanobacteriota bacterium]
MGGVGGVVRVGSVGRWKHYSTFFPYPLTGTPGFTRTDFTRTLPKTRTACKETKCLLYRVFVRYATALHTLLERHTLNGALDEECGEGGEKKTPRNKNKSAQF